ncbi:MAG TPA: alpha-hydroxy acid oxidase [Mycobacteriales bacterium]|nr:alpha-hydroxy acid oxidase [Mycobacteriales bacterium]
MSASARRLPRWSVVSQFVAPSLRRGTSGPLAKVRSCADFERLARKRTPRAVFDYVDGAAEREVAVRRSAEAFASVEFSPHVLRDVSEVTTETTILGRRATLPVVLGPTGFTRMMRTEGEPAVARAAGRAGVPYALSTMGTTSLESLAAAAPDTDNWFQLYLWKDRARSTELIERVAASGYQTLVLTVDVPVAGARLRDVRNGLTIPPRLTPTTMVDMARHPRWLLDTLTTEPLSFASLGAADDLMSLINTVFDPSTTLSDVEWLRERWPGQLVIKGIQRVDDAKAVVAAGADAVAVSSHGGRQLDRAPTPLRLLPDVVDAVAGATEVYLDGGVRCGADVAAAVALGARAVFVARPYLYALMAAGEAGVDRLLAVLLEDYTRTLQLLGVTSTASLDRDYVRLLP